LLVASPARAIQTLKKDQVFTVPVQGQFFTDKEALVLLNKVDKYDFCIAQGIIKTDKITLVEEDSDMWKGRYTKLKKKRAFFGKLTWAGFAVSFVAGAVLR